jgi:hypothetical protein
LKPNSRLIDWNEGKAGCMPFKLETLENAFCFCRENIFIKFMKAFIVDL